MKASSALFLLVASLATPASAAPSEPHAGPGTVAVRPSTPPRTELELWSSPAFRRAFTQSYIAETEIEPRVTQDEREKMLEVMDLIAEDRMDKAANLLQKNLGPATSAVFDFTLGNIYFQTDRLEEAAGAYRVAVEKYPKFRRAWRHIGLIRARDGEFAEALPALRKVVELGGGDAVTYGLMGFAYSNVENDLSAESAFRMANLLDPETMDWKMGLARSFFKQERYAEAAALCGNLIAENPERADLWLLQANAFLSLNQPLRAAGNYELVEKLGGSTAGSLNTLGDIYANQELEDLAVDTYLQALECDPAASVPRALRAAKLMTARGALAPTKRLLERVEPLLGEGASTEQRKDVLELRARIAMVDGATEEEASLLERIVALDPLDGEALILLGKHVLRSDEPEKAIFYFERAESIESSEADAKVQHAQVLVRTGRYTEALPLLKSAQLLKPRDSVQQYLDQVERLARSR